MSDCELLELAAKAHGGIPAAVVGAEPGYYWCGATCAPQWNPLTDDGDALRLAVRLRLCIGPNLDGDMAVAFGDDCPNMTEPYAPNPYAATRRAIVRAAAEIGRGMGGSNYGGEPHAQD
ncbi:MAG TPA: hypothetical protein P5038_21745 [Candidatus Paceibacterota bacterium]|nr:hypothetical protein [Candidatus Paceibacterota bacterium]